MKYQAPVGSIVLYQKKKYRVTDTKCFELNEDNDTLEAIYIYEHLPYAKTNQSNTGIYIYSNILVTPTLK